MTVPLPLPLVDDVMEMNPELLAAVHAQPLPAETLTDALPPAAGALATGGVIE